MTDPYAHTLDTVRDCLTCRARQYKYLVIVLTAVALTAILSAASLASLAPLASVGMLPSLVLAYVALDVATINRWREVALQHWSATHLRLDQLSEMLRQAPFLPGRTVAAMLASLPKFDHVIVPMMARPALLRAQQELSKASIQLLWARVAVWSVGGGAVLASGLTAKPVLLALPLLVLPPIRLLSHMKSRRRLGRARIATLGDLQAAGFSESAAAPWLDALDFQGLPADLVSAWRTTPPAACPASTTT